MFWGAHNTKDPLETSQKKSASESTFCSACTFTRGRIVWEFRLVEGIQTLGLATSYARRTTKERRKPGCLPHFTRALSARPTNKTRVRCSSRTNRWERHVQTPRASPDPPHPPGISRPTTGAISRFFPLEILRGAPRKSRGRMCAPLTPPADARDHPRVPYCAGFAAQGPGLGPRAVSEHVLPAVPKPPGLDRQRGAHQSVLLEDPGDPMLELCRR